MKAQHALLKSEPMSLGTNSYVVMALLLLAGCSSEASSSGGSGQGGTSVTGGAQGLGGSFASSGGTPGNGGATNTGGSVASGGSAPAGGAVGTGGLVSTGGTSTKATGGSASSGGSRATGGLPAVAGSISTGGATGAGGATGGSASGGATLGSGGARGGAVGTGGVTVGVGGSVGSGGSAQTGGSNTGTFQPCPTTGACKIMPLGDSITEGTGYAGGYRGILYRSAVTDTKSITFVGSLTTNPATGITGFPTAHEGHFAWTIQQVDNIIPTPTLDVSPHIVLLHLGTNDVNQNLTGASTRLKSVVSQIVTALPNSLLVVAKLIPSSGSTAADVAYNADIPAIVQEQVNSGKHVILVDQYTGFPTSELGDGVHPNQAGYTRMAGVWYAAIKPYLH